MQTPSLTAYITVKDAGRAIEFYAKALGGRELFRLADTAGKVGHAEVAFGETVLMLSDEYPDFGALSPATVGGCPAKLHLYVDDVDAVVARAVEQGAVLVRPVKDEFYGDRVGMIADPFGYSWFISTHKHDVTPEEMQRHWTAALAGQ